MDTDGTFWVAYDPLGNVWDADDDQTELLRRLTDRYGLTTALWFQLGKLGPAPRSVYGLDV